MMNPVCFICKQPGMRICTNKKCKEEPFICQGPCVKSAAQKLHIHQLQGQFLNLNNLNESIQMVKLKIDPSFHKQHFQEIRKKVTILKDMLDNFVNQYEKDFNQNLTFSPTQRTSEILQKIQESKWGQLTGGDLAYIMGGTELYVEQQYKQNAITSLKNIYQNSFSSIQKDMGNYISYKTRVQQGKKLYDEGVALKEKQQYKQAIQKFIKAKQYNNFDYLISFQLGHCYSEISCNKQAEQYYIQSLKLKKYQTTYNNLGFLKNQLRQYYQSLQYYNKAIEIKQSALYYSNRGDVLTNLKRYQQAYNDFQKACQLSNTQNYKNNLMAATRKLSEHRQYIQYNQNQSRGFFSL